MKDHAWLWVMKRQCPSGGVANDWDGECIVDMVAKGKKKHTVRNWPTSKRSKGAGRRTERY
jgi:hypothetical protein